MLFRNSGILTLIDLPISTVGLGVIVMDNNIEMDWAELAPVCQGAVFMAAKFEVFLILSLKTFTHFTFSLELIRQTPLSLPSFPFISQTKHQLWAMAN